MKILSKITIKNVVGGVKGNPELLKKLLEANPNPIPLVTVIGQATGTKEMVREFEDGKTSTSVKFKGSFKATNLMTGEVFKSGVCYLPPVAANLLEGAFGEKTQAVQFAFRIGARYDKDAATSYVYEVESLMEASENDPVELLEKVLGEKAVLSLPAPQKDAGELGAPTEPASAPEPAEPEKAETKKSKKQAA